MSMQPQQMNPQAIGQALDQRLAQQTQQAAPMQGFQPQAFQPAPMMGMPQMMPAAMMGAPPAAPQGLLVPVQLNLPDGRECTVYVQLGPEAVQNPMGAIQGLINSGVPVKAFQPRQQGGGNGGAGWGGNGNQRGSWGGGRGRW